MPGEDPEQGIPGRTDGKSAAWEPSQHSDWVQKLPILLFFFFFANITFIHSTLNK